MQQEYDFSKGEKGKFYRENVTLNLPIYLEPDIQKFIEEIALKKGVDIGAVVNKIIKNNMQLVQEFS